MKRLLCILLGFLTGWNFSSPSSVSAASVSTPGDRVFAEYFRQETAHLAQRCLADASTLDAWKARRETYRQQLLEMLGLWPLPERTDLHPVITGRVESEQFTVENLYFQSRPGLYVTGNLYLPKGQKGPFPAILYVCGHASEKSGGVSLGNKTHYQHHGAWFARNGYVCLVIDTIQLGELEGIHHGTYREGMWWWNARGYTPAGVEAWNSVRALDYLETRPEVDAKRMGMTGRSGGGAYTWWTAAIDERVKVAVPVAGITDLRNYVVDGAVAGHCDCMFMVNTWRWDYPQVAALVAPRPLLISNTDKDTLFPLDGLVRLHEKVRNIYRLYGASANLGLLITEGPHEDTQDLQVPAFRWFNRFLKGEQPLIETTAVKFFPNEQLKVFKELPADQITTKIHETFVPQATPAVPATADAWKQQREEWMTALREKVFAGWPAAAEPLALHPAWQRQSAGWELGAYDFVSQEPISLRLYVLRESSTPLANGLTLQALDAAGWSHRLAAVQAGFGDVMTEELSVAKLVNDVPALSADATGWSELQSRLRREHTVLAWVAPRGIGLTATNPDPREQTQCRRRFQLLGQTLESMRVWDLRRALQAVRSLPGNEHVPVHFVAEGTMAVNAVYAALFEPPVADLQLTTLPVSHRAGPDYLNVLRFLDVPQALTLAVERVPVKASAADPAALRFARETEKNLGWPQSRLITLP